MKFNLNSEKIKYIKITYSDANGTSHCAKAAVKSISAREIYACTKVEVPLCIKTPQEISLGIICDDGLYNASTTLKFIQNQEPYVFFTMNYPDDFVYQQNREFFRVRMEGKVLVRFHENVIPCKIYDISANGIRVVPEKDIKFPDDVTLEILFAPKSVKTAAKYIRTDVEDDIFKAAFSFVNLSDSGRDIISQKCIQKQLEDKRKQYE